MKNKMLIGWSLLLFPILSFSLVKRTDLGTKSLVEVSLQLKSEKQSINGRDFSELKLIGAGGHDGIHYQVGHPQLPVLRFYFKVAKNSDIIVSKSAERSVRTLQRNLLPSTPSLPKVKGANRILVQDKLAYGSDQTRKSFYTIESVGRTKGIEKKLLTIYPVAYQGKSKKVHFTSNFKIQVKNQLKDTFSSLRMPTFAFIAPTKFINSRPLQDYKSLKERLGYNVEVIEIKSSNNNSAAIRKSLQKIYNDSYKDLRYALIFGDAQDVAAHKATYIYGVTDHYYRSIDTNDYLKDINSPDIGVGRISVSTISDLENVIDKYIRYQVDNDHQAQWINSAAFIATDDRWQVAEGTHNYVIDNYTQTLGVMGSFPNSVQKGGDKLYAITHNVSDAEVVERMKSGRSIINYSGHGGTTYWAGPHVYPRDVKKLDHTSAIPFVISNACITGQFTISESFGETWQRHPYGAIVFWGSMDNTYWDEDDVLEKRMYDGIYKLGNRTFKDITWHALSEHWKHYGGAGKSKYYWETYVMFGDPSIELRSTF